MTIADYNLKSKRALKIERSSLRLSATAFIGFCIFLVSRGSMAAPTAK